MATLNFSAHVLDRMAERGITKMDVYSVLTKGRKARNRNNLPDNFVATGLDKLFIAFVLKSDGTVIVKTAFYPTCPNYAARNGYFK